MKGDKGLDRQWRQGPSWSPGTPLIPSQAREPAVSAGIPEAPAPWRCQGGGRPPAHLAPTPSCPTLPAPSVPVPQPPAQAMDKTHHRLPHSVPRWSTNTGNKTFLEQKRHASPTPRLPTSPHDTTLPTPVTPLLPQALPRLCGSPSSFSPPPPASPGPTGATPHLLLTGATPPLSSRALCLTPLPRTPCVCLSPAHPLLHTSSSGRCPVT